MITVVEFRAKQATGSRYMPTDKFYANYSKFIWIDWSTPKFCCGATFGRKDELKVDIEDMSLHYYNQ